MLAQPLAARPGPALEQAVGEQHQASPGRQGQLGLGPLRAGHQAHRGAGRALDQLDTGGAAQQQARMTGPEQPDMPVVSAEGEMGQGGEDVLVLPLSHQQLLQQSHHGQRRGPGQDQRAPRHPEADTERRLGHAVPADIADDRVHGAVRGLHHVIEVAAEQRVGPARTVPGDHLEIAGADQRGGQQSPLQPGVLLRAERADLQLRGSLLDLLALRGVPDSAAEDVWRGLALDQVILGAGRDRGQASALLGQPGEHHHRGARDGGQQLGDRVDPLHIGQVQVEQDAAWGRRPGGHVLGLGQRPHPRQRGLHAAVREQLLDQQRIARVILDQQHRGRLAEPFRALPVGAAAPGGWLRVPVRHRLAGPGRHGHRPPTRRAPNELLLKLTDGPPTPAGHRPRPGLATQ